MKKVQLTFSALAAIIGIGGAYASYAPTHNAFAETHIWTTRGGTVVRSLNHATTLTVSNVCHPPYIDVCLKSITNGPVTIFGIYQ